MPYPTNGPILDEFGDPISKDCANENCDFCDGVTAEGTACACECHDPDDRVDDMGQEEES
jgi:hypothetical protein